MQTSDPPPPAKISSPLQAAARSLGGLVAGVAVALVLGLLVEGFGAVVHPFPKGFDFSSEQQMIVHVARFPAWVLAAVVPLWGLTSYASCWTARRVGGRWGIGTAVLVALLLVAMTVCNMMMLPYAAWFKLLAPLTITIAALIGCGVLRRAS